MSLIKILTTKTPMKMKAVIVQPIAFTRRSSANTTRDARETKPSGDPTVESGALVLTRAQRQHERERDHQDTEHRECIAPVK